MEATRLQFDGCDKTNDDIVRIYFWERRGSIKWKGMRCMRSAIMQLLSIQTSP